MSSETDNPRQRTVAELLAQHGSNDAASTGRRRRRREPDDEPDDATGTGQPAANGSPPTAWPQARSPQAERPTSQPPTALGGPAAARESGPRPPGALPHQYSPQNSPQNSSLPNGQSNGQSNGAPNGAGQGVPGQWGQPPRREPDRGRPAEPGRDAAPGHRPDGFGSDASRSEPPEPRRDPAAPDRPVPARDGQPRPEQSGARWDAQARPDRPAPSWDRPAPVPEAQSTGQWNPYGPPRSEQGPREQGPRDQPPPRAFAPGPEPVRGGPPHASTPHAGSAPLAASALPAALFGPQGPSQPGQPGQPGQQPGRPPFEQPTGLNPPYGRPGVVDPNLTGPIDLQRFEAGRQSEATNRVQAAPPRADRPDPTRDDGPATEVAIPPTAADDRLPNRTGQDQQGGAPDPDGGPPTAAASPMDFDEFDDVEDRPAGLGTGRGRGVGGSGALGRVGAGVLDRPDEDADELDDTDDAVGEGEGGAQSWAPVLAQWIIGAVGGAALWVGFRYLWSSFLVVAIAAAILVTAGLVIVVRTLLRNSDLRTTIAAIAVGILLTVSPAVLVLLGR